MSLLNLGLVVHRQCEFEEGVARLRRACKRFRSNSHVRLEFSDRRFSWSTIRQSSAIDSAPIFRIMLLRWTLTVVSVMPMSPAICLFSRPSAT